MSDFTEKIKNLRKAKNLTQKQVALELGLAERNYQHYEAGSKKPSFDGLINLCNYFNVSSDYLLGLSDDPTKK